MDRILSTLCHRIVPCAPSTIRANGTRCHDDWMLPHYNVAYVQDLSPRGGVMTDARRVAVTGAASGIGAATARRLMADGWRVACLDRDIAGARVTAGNDGLAIELDVADEAASIRAFAQLSDKWGGLDALVTAAGVIETVPFLETTPAQFRRLFDINVIGSFLTVREASKQMAAGSRICMVASISS